jgi:hypothetical protein
MVATKSVVALCKIHHLAMVATRNLAMVAQALVGCVSRSSVLRRRDGEDARSKKIADW